MTGQTKGPVAGRRADAVRNRARVLAAAEEVFDRLGGTASTAEIARVAGVGIGTVFRHFPTKQDLLAAIVKERLDRLWVEAEDLVAGDDPEAFFVFFRRLVRQSAGKKSIVDALAQEGVGLRADKPIGTLQRLIEPLLTRAKAAGLVRADAELPEVMGVLTGTCQAALGAGWDEDLQARVLDIVFTGLRPR